MKTVKKALRNYYQSVNKGSADLSTCCRNLNLLYVEGKLTPCYNRQEEVTQILKILLRRNKANVLLTGVAGCGKTAVVEAVAEALVMRRVEYEKACNQAMCDFALRQDAWEKLPEEERNNKPKPVYKAPRKPLLCDCTVYELSLNSMVSGTKYRGEFEDRMKDLLAFCQKHPEVILFVDEFHAITRIGGAEGCVSAAQILKPALARKEISMIAATTTEEKAVVMEDKALARRFAEIEVQPLTGDVAVDTARQILQDYSTYHQVKTDVSAGDLLSQVQYFLPETVFPDNFINLVDETMASAVFDGIKKVDMTHFSATLSRMSGKMILPVFVGNQEGMAS